jgi:hypothetical protein
MTTKPLIEIALRLAGNFSPEDVLTCWVLRQQRCGGSGRLFKQPS